MLYCHTFYIVCRMSYVVRLHRCTVALIWHSPSHDIIPGADHWEFVGVGIGIYRVVKLQQLGCVGLRRVRRVMWFAKRGWHPQADRFSAHNINTNSLICAIVPIATTITIGIITIVIANISAMSVFTVSPQSLSSRCAHVVLWYAHTYALCACCAIFCGGGPAVRSAQRTTCCLFVLRPIWKYERLINCAPHSQTFWNL